MKFGLKVKFHLLLLVMIAVIYTGCITTKKAKDRSVSRHARRNSDQIAVVSQYALKYSMETGKTFFMVSEVEDRQMKRKIGAIGGQVKVHYQDEREVPDSNVTFTNVSVFGFTEIIYDFASTERTFNDSPRNGRWYCFVRVSDRIYYRRRSIPIM